MAVYPCDYQPHRYPDPQQSVYVTWTAGELLQTTGLRLCPVHFELVKKVIGKHLACIDEDSQMSVHCERCGKDRECTVFVKVYAHKAEVQNWAADFCAGDAEQVLADLHASNGRRLAER